MIQLIISVLALIIALHNFIIQRLNEKAFDDFIRRVYASPKTNMFFIPTIPADKKTNPEKKE